MSQLASDTSIPFQWPSCPIGYKIPSAGLSPVKLQCSRPLGDHFCLCCWQILFWPSGGWWSCATPRVTLRGVLADLLDEPTAVRCDKQSTLPLLVPGLYTTVKSNCCSINNHQLTWPPKYTTSMGTHRGENRIPWWHPLLPDPPSQVWSSFILLSSIVGTNRWC